MAAEPDGELSMGARRSRGGESYVSEIQRGRLLSATFALVGERGYGGVSARGISERAGVSNRTFYECFSDREDCFLAAFNHAVDGLELEVRAGWESQLGWTARVRGALAALLLALDREPVLARLVVVEALSAGPRVLARRASVLQSLAGVVDQGRTNARAPKVLPGLVAEGVVGATFGVIHARLLELRAAPLIGLLGQLTGMIVLPYRGSAAAAKELARPTPRLAVRLVAPGRRGASRSRTQGAWRAMHASDRGRRPIVRDRPAPLITALDYRLTVRTQMALAAVGGRPGLNNRDVSEIIGLSDQGQVSRMMKRLVGQGLVENTHGDAGRQLKAWRLTKDGEAVIDAHRALKQAQRRAGKGGKLATTRSARGRRGKSRPLAETTAATANAGFRMTALTHEVLTTVAKLGARGSSPSNREIARAAGVKDEGQISKLLRRLQDHGLLENTGGGYPSAGNAWRLTSRGEEILSTSSPDRAWDGAMSTARVSNPPGAPEITHPNP